MTFQPLKQHSRQIAAAGLTILALLSYDFLPTKSSSLYPFPQEGTALYSDKDDGGNSKAEWVDRGDEPSFDCLLASGAPYPYCGLSHDLDQASGDFMDLSAFDTIKIHIAASEDVSTVRVYFRNYNSAYSTARSGSTLMFAEIFLGEIELNKPVEIPMGNFRVAQWWIDQMKVDRQHTVPDFTKVKTIGIDLNDSNPAGINHRITVHKITFVGNPTSKENWYLIVALLWACFFLFKGIKTAVDIYQRSKRDRQLIQSMSRIQDSLIEKNVEFEKDSTIDPLTDTYNRRGLIKRLQDLQDGREPGKHHAVIVADIDHFKSINDIHGHDIGDEVIKHVAAICIRGTRGHDTVCRWGGEEFIVICPNCSPENAFIIAEKIRKEIERFEFCESPPIKATVSFGIAAYNSDEDFDEAFKRADSALMLAKKEGRNRVHVEFD